MQTRETYSRILLFDGHCHLCSGWARFLMRHRVEPPFQLVAMQSAAGRALLLPHGIDPDDPASFLVLDEGQELTQSDAVIHVIAAMGGAWRCAYAACIVPRRWRDAIYHVLARNRYRWFGRRATCYLPD